MRRDEKAEVVAELQQELDGATHLIITDYRGLTVKELTELRRAIRAAGGRMKVVKKTLLIRALAGRAEEALVPHLEGPIAATFVSGDAMPVLKGFTAFARGHAELELRGGWVDGRALSASQLVEIAALPPREELLARLLACMQAPLANLVMTLQAVPRDLVLTLQTLADKRAAGAAAGG